MDAIVYVSFDESSLPPKYNAKSFYVDGSFLDYSTSLPIARSAEASMPEPAIKVSATITVPYPARYNNAGSNCVPNGDASMGNITNFPGMTYIADDGYNSPGCFQRAAYADFHSTTLMPVDINRKYTIQGTFKSIGAGGLSRLYFGVTCYDKNGFFIQCRQSYHILNTETTLAQPLNNGDTVVHLTSVANWRTGTQGAFGYDKMFGAWLPDDGYDDYTYTRRVQPYISVDAVNNTITLQAAWAQGSIPAGSAVANTYDSGTYNYTAASYAAVPAEWTTYAGTLTGVSATGLASAFRYGTTHVGVMALMNYGQDTTYVTRLDDVIFQDVGADLEIVPETSGNATVSATTGTASSAGISPSISWGSTVTGAIGATTVNTAVPSIGAGASIAVTASTISTDTIAPVCTAGAKGAAVTGTTAIAGMAPDISWGSTLNGTVGTATISAATPNIGAGASIVGTVGTSSTDATVSILTAGATGACTIGVISIAGVTPSIAWGSTITGATATGSVTACTPSTQVDALAISTAANITIAAIHPVLQADALSTSTVSTVNTTTHTPSVQADAVIASAAAASTIVAAVPSIIIDTIVLGALSTCNVSAFSPIYTGDAGVDATLSRASATSNVPDLNMGAVLAPDVGDAIAAAAVPNIETTRNPQIDVITASIVLAGLAPTLAAIRNPQVEAVAAADIADALPPDVCAGATVPTAVSISDAGTYTAVIVATALTDIDTYASVACAAFEVGAGGGAGATPTEGFCDAPTCDVIADAFTSTELGTAQTVINLPNVTANAAVSSVPGINIADVLFAETYGNSLLEASIASLNAAGQVPDVTAAALLEAPITITQLSSEAPLLLGDALTNIDVTGASTAVLESIPSGSALQVLDITEPAALQAVAPISSICPIAAAASAEALAGNAVGNASVLAKAGTVIATGKAPASVSVIFSVTITCAANADVSMPEVTAFGSARIASPTAGSVTAISIPLLIENPVPVVITTTIDAVSQAPAPELIGSAGVNPEALHAIAEATAPAFSGDATISVEAAASSTQAMVAVPSANIELDAFTANSSAQALSDISWQLSSNAICSNAAQVTIITLIPITYSPELKFAAYLMCYEQQTATIAQEHKRSAIVFVDNKADIVAFIPDTQYLAHLMQYESQTGLDCREHRGSIITYAEGASIVGIKTATGGNRILEALTNIKYTP